MKTILTAAVLAAVSLPALAQDVLIRDTYIRASGKMSKAAAAFMKMHNATDAPIRLIGAQTDVARKAELHTHIMENDVAKMREIEGGVTIAPGETHIFQRGADHVMLMGLTEALEQGDTVEVTLIFENLDPVKLEIEVDNGRKPNAHGKMDNSGN